MLFNKMLKPRRAFKRSQKMITAYLVVSATTVMVADVHAQQSQTDVIQLESTIRGDQQQPRVISIVPWNSPPHKRVSKVALTGERSEVMQPIERSAFLQRIALHQLLLGESSSGTNTDALDSSKENDK